MKRRKKSVQKADYWQVVKTIIEFLMILYQLIQLF